MIPLVREFLADSSFPEDEGNYVRIIAEGLAAAEFKKGDIPLYFEGTRNFQDEPFSLSRDLVLKLFFGAVGPRPNVDVVVSGSSSPINLERQFSQIARSLGVPVVALEDFWGGHLRLDVKPDLLLCLDEYAEKLALERHGSIRTAVVGNHGVSREINPSPKALEFFSKFRSGKFRLVLSFFGGGTDCTSAEISMLVESLKLTSFSDWCLIPRLHPKLKDTKHPSGSTWGEVWRKELSVFGDRLIWADHLSTEDVVVLGNVLFAGFSTTLTTAAVAGKRAISLWPPETRASLRKQTGLDQVPLVALGCARQITKPKDLLLTLSAPLPNTSKLKPYDPKIAYRAIKDFVGT